MKTCPTCQREFADSLAFCLDDGTPLVVRSRSDSEPTLVAPSPSAGSQIPPTFQPQGAPQLNVPVMPGYRSTPQKKRVWPWVLAGGAVLFIFVLLIAATIAIPKLAQTSKNRRGPIVLDSPTPQFDAWPTPAASPSEEAVPTDEDVALSQLTELEKRWTAANVDGDKDALDRILADEYRGGDSAHTKQQYLDELKPDPTVKSWELQDLAVDLDGDRATMTGYLRSETTEGLQVYSFTDEFVWRDGRWQATGSRTTRVK